VSRNGFDCMRSWVISSQRARRYPQLVAKDAEVAVNTILGAMAMYLVKGQRIEIRRFGSFGINYRPPRTGHNPKSGQKVQVKNSV